MLQNEHSAREYAKPEFSVRSWGALGYARAFRTYSPVYGQDEESSRGGTLEVGDSGEVSLDEFVERYLDTRDRLAYRRIRGEVLSPREASLLTVLNHMVDKLLPRPTALPSDVKATVEEVLRLTRR